MTNIITKPQKDIWLISDTHHGHKNVLTFTNKEGNLIRPGFSSVEEMDDLMVHNWNSVVKPGDRVYHLGDVYMGPSEYAHSVLNKLHGRKNLILGNHDEPSRDSILFKFFKKVRLWRQFGEHDILLTHVPVHESSLFRVKYNVHGHIHQNESPPGPYFNVSVENINYTPIHIEDLKQKLAKL